MMAYLKTIMNPNDEVSLLRIINVPARNISDSTVEKLLDRAVRSGQRLWDVVGEAAREKIITAKAADAISKFQSMLKDFRARFDVPGSSPSAIFENLVDEIDYESEIAKQYKDVQQQLARSAVIEEFISSMREYESRAEKPTIDGFLEDSSLDMGDRDFGEDKQIDRPAIKLMTLHSAKGLEFPRVYLVGWEEGILPHQRSLDDDTPSAIEEERRLAYVGITRAKDHLTITHSGTRMKWGKRRMSLPSRFLREMQESLEESTDNQPESSSDTPLANPHMENE